MGFKFKAIPRWLLTAAGLIEPTNGETIRVPKLQIDDANTYLDKDGTNNLTFTDAVTGTKTLAELASGGALALHELDTSTHGCAEIADVTDISNDTNLSLAAQSAISKAHDALHAASHAVSGADTVFPADPGADRYLMWDDNPGVLVWASIAGGGDMLKATYDPNDDGVIAAAQLDTTVIVEGDVDDVAVDGVTTAPISSNWAFDHAAATTGVHGVGAGTVAKTADIATDANLSAAAQSAIAASHSVNDVGTHGTATTGVHGVGAGTIAKTADITATKIDDLTQGDDNTDLDSSTTRHGLLLKATAPAAGLYNYVGITNAEAAYTNKALFDATAPTDSDAVSAGAVGTAAVAARRDHVHKLDAAIADDAVLTVDDAAAADNDFAIFTANGIEGTPAQTAHSLLLAQVLLENDSIQLDPALSADGKWNGITESGTAGATLAFGDICYFAVADSRWELAKADAAATSFGKLGICVLAAANDGSATNMLLWGKVRADAVFPAMTVGAPVFISAATAGDVTSTAPTGTTNFVVRIIGYGNTADELYFCPDNTYLELA